MDSSLKLKCLLQMTPQIHGVDYMQAAAKHLFLVQMKFQPSVKDVFFHSNNQMDNQENRTSFKSLLKGIKSFDEFDFDHFGVLLVCQTICKLRNHFNFHELLDEEKVEEELACFYADPLWITLGFQLYCMSAIETMVDLQTGVKLKQFVEDNKTEWAERIVDHYKSGFNILEDFPFVLQSRQTTQTCVNLLLTKLHLLDPSKTKHLFQQLSQYIPDIKFEYQTIKYLGPTFDWRMIRDDVETAILKPSLPSNVSKMSLSTLEVYHGIGVCEFIMSEAREMGVWTGKYPHNHSISHLTDRCCIS